MSTVYNRSTCTGTYSEAIQNRNRAEHRSDISEASEVEDRKSRHERCRVDYSAGDGTDISGSTINGSNAVMKPSLPRKIPTVPLGLELALFGSMLCLYIY